MKTHRGFTIVELLIVIVVIAVLAGITVVAFNGVRNRADASRSVSAVNSYVKLLKLHAQTTGSYPSIESSPYEYCLGRPSDFPAEGVFSAGQCIHNSASSYSVFTNQALNDTLSTYGQGSNTRLSNSKLGNETWRGIRYSHMPSISYPPTLEWVVNGSTPCTPGVGTPGNSAGSTYCRLEL